MTKRPSRFFLAITAAALIAGQATAADPLQACRGAKLKAAGAYGKKVAGCVAKAIKKSPAFGESLVTDALAQCRTQQLPAFERKYRPR